MRITVEDERTVREKLEAIFREYGPLEALERHVSTRPEDTLARIALHDAREYANRDPDERIRETRDLVIPDEALDQLTMQRVRLLLALKSRSGRADSIRHLARLLRRDVKNVSQDVQVLSRLGLIHVDPDSRGKPSRVSLPAKRIDLHLVEA